METALLHQPVDTDRDPDLEQAVEDFLPVAAEIRRLTRWMLQQEPGSRERAGIENQIRDKMGLITARADRLRLSADALLLILNAKMDRRTRRGRGLPVRPTSLTLRSAHEAAMIRLQAAHDQVTHWTTQVETERKAVAAAEQALRAAGVRVIG
jgi:hypothetical protein